MRLRCATAQMCEPSAEASSDCAPCLTNSSLPADFQEVPRSRETSTPVLVAAYQAALVKVRSLTCEARSCGALEVLAGRFAAAFLFPSADASGRESVVKSPTLTHLALVSSYFIKPPLLREAHQPMGEA